MHPRGIFGPVMMCEAVDEATLPRKLGIEASGSMLDHGHSIRYHRKDPDQHHDERDEGWEKDIEPRGSKNVIQLQWYQDGEQHKQYIAYQINYWVVQCDVPAKDLLPLLFGEKFQARVLHVLGKILLAVELDQSLPILVLVMSKFRIQFEIISVVESLP